MVYLVYIYIYIYTHTRLGLASDLRLDAEIICVKGTVATAAFAARVTIPVIAAVEVILDVAFYMWALQGFGLVSSGTRWRHIGLWASGLV